MAIVWRYSKPDLFLTFTCNPKWEEIQNALFPNQLAADRPDIVARVFNQKKKAFQHDIVVGQIFRKVLAYVCIVEFQKRGLPHLHTLVILHQESKPRSSDHYDIFVTAEIPDPSQTRLHNMIVQNMIHRPCGTANPRSPCMEQGKCTKQFPKQFCETTQSTHNGYPLYRRRDSGPQVQNKQSER